MTMFFSPSESAIYTDSLYDDYVSAGTWPKDAVKISDETAKEFHPSKQPSNKILGTGQDDLPEWVDIPKPDKATLVKEAELKKKSLLSEANIYTQIWQTQLLLDMISDVDKSSLTVWMAYCKSVQSIDTSEPSKIVWPKAPAS